MADDYSMSDFVTPGQIKAQRDMAEALLKQSMITPVGRVGEAVSPFAIGTQMADALAGSYIQNKAGQQERASHLGEIHAEPEAPGTLGPPGLRAVSDATDPSGRALASLESGGDYNAIGPVIKHGSMAGQHGIGKYQVMESNIPKWTQEFLGHQMTPGEFLRNPAAQETVRKGQFAKYAQQFGEEGAARAWYGGPGNVNNPSARDLTHPKAPNVGQYGQNYMRNLAQLGGAPTSPEGGQALAFSGEPAVSAAGPPGAPAPMAEALAGGDTKVAGGPKAAPGGSPVPAETGPGGAMRVPPGFIKGRPTMTREQFERAMAGAVARGDTATQAYLRGIYMEQHAPIPFTGPYGIPGMANPDTGEQTFLPPPPTFAPREEKTKTGPLEDEIREQEPIYTVPPGYKGPPPPGIVRGGRSAAPVAPAPVAPAPPAAVPKPLDLSTPPKPTGKGSEAEGRTKYASLETGTMTDASPETGGGPLAVKPPAGATAAVSPDATVIPTAAPPGPTAAPVKVADAGMRGMSVPERLGVALDYEGELQRRKSGAELSEKQLAEYGDSSNRLMQSSNRLRQQINESRELINSGLPVFGPYTGAKLEGLKVLAAGGNKAAQARLASTEAFGKNMASEILSEMKTQLEKLGQVRIAEIDLLKTATASTQNTPQSNQVILDILERFNNQARTIAGITEQYQQGVRWDANGKPVVDKDGNAVLSKTPPNANKLRSTIGGFVDRNPLYGDDETKQMMETLDPGSATRGKLAKEKADAEAKEKKAKEPKAAAPAEEPKPTGRGPELPKGFTLNPKPAPAGVPGVP